ncbi:MAG: sensor histidine kinase [Planctomycetota bacterium]
MLLAVAVILPTVCLLWFMSQAVKNERLAVQQKLINVYSNKALEVRNEVDRRWKNQEEHVAENLRVKGLPASFDSLISSNASNADGIVIYDSNGECIYPTQAPEMSEETELAEELEGAWEVEFSQKDLESAMKLYEEIADKSESAYCYYKALLGQVRCLRGLGEIDKAIDVCERIIYKSSQKKKDKRSLFLKANAKLLYAELRKEIRNRDLDSEWKFQASVRNLLNMIGDYNRSGRMPDISSEQRVFLGRKAFELIEESGPFLPVPDYNDIPGAIARISNINRKLLAAEELSLQVASKHINPRGGLLRVYEKLPGADSSVYYFNCKADDKTVMLLRQRENFIHEPKVAREKGMIYDLKYYTEAFENSDVAYRIVDRWNSYIGGVITPKGEPLLSTSVGTNFPGWKLELYLKDNSSFEEAARRQAAIYIWTGVLVIVLILASGGIAGQAVGSQIKLNRLKNDFIATVSHELKTPLASMRVLADTLLEGNYKDQKQATEYLHLICKENKRLSGLIDNFLTFSRMERNKHAFEMAKRSPAVVANAAVEAVKTKFSKGQCEFEVKISDDLPDVSADHDAIVTVLVNLLDNAYKYSHDDKHIEFRVFTEDGQVCFSVSDNGIGLSQRAIKKIFKRFYQVDRSLSRRSEGCGLGLSIAKFIVDAHRGSITVDSKPDTGSTFTVKLPAVN